MDSDPSLDEPLIAYSLTQYLLDRVNIHDTITRLVIVLPFSQSILMTQVCIL